MKLSPHSRGKYKHLPLPGYYNTCMLIHTDKLKNASNAISCLTSEQHSEVIDFILSEICVKKRTKVIIAGIKCMELHGCAFGYNYRCFLLQWMLYFQKFYLILL